MHHPAYGHLLQGRRLTDEAVKSVLTVDYETNHHPAYGHLLQGRRLTDEAVKSVLTTDHRLLKREKLPRTFAGELFVFISLLG